MQSLTFPQVVVMPCTVVSRGCGRLWPCNFGTRDFGILFRHFNVLICRQTSEAQCMTAQIQVMGMEIRPGEQGLAYNTTMK